MYKQWPRLMSTWVLLAFGTVAKGLSASPQGRLLKRRRLIAVRTMRASFQCVGAATSPLWAGQNLCYPVVVRLAPVPLISIWQGLAALGASVEIESGYVRASAERG